MEKKENCVVLRFDRAIIKKSLEKVETSSKQRGMRMIKINKFHLEEYDDDK